MSLADRVEGWLQRRIEGLFGRRAGGVQPVEIGRRLARLLEERKQVSVSAVYAPNAFAVSLSPPDYAVLASIAPRLSEELVHHLNRVARQHGFSLVGPLSVSWQEGDHLASGVFEVQASFSPAGDPEGGAQGESVEPGEAGEHTMVFRRPTSWEGAGDGRLEAADRSGARSDELAEASLSVVRGPDAGRILRLRPGENRVGRAEENELVLVDSNVSRYHAVITWNGGRAQLRDLGSRNGTRRNGEPLGEAELVEGDELQMGLDVLSFRER